MPAGACYVFTGGGIPPRKEDMDMSLGKTVIGAGIAAGGIYAGVKALERMDGSQIRECGEAVKTAVGRLGRSAGESEIVQDLRAKLSETEYGPKLLDFAGSAGDSLSSGFDKFVDMLAECREDAENGRGSFAGSLAERLTGAVADGAEYIAEHIPSGKSLGESGANALAGYLSGFQASEPEAEGPEAGM